MSENMVQAAIGSRQSAVEYPKTILEQRKKSSFTNQKFCTPNNFSDQNRKIIIFIFICVQHSKLHSYALCEISGFFSYYYAVFRCRFLLACVCVFVFSHQVASEHTEHTTKQKIVQLLAEYLVLPLSCHTENAQYSSILLTNETFLFVSLFAPKIK